MAELQNFGMDYTTLNWYTIFILSLLAGMLLINILRRMSVFPEQDERISGILRHSLTLILALLDIFSFIFFHVDTAFCIYDAMYGDRRLVRDQDQIQDVALEEPNNRDESSSEDDDSSLEPRPFYSGNTRCL
ncbi:uncharacterized protein LOC129958179 [Argiope bruennichi]|uniref:uncharacterized protein LOC129958179 n=1 Tax=Argiope bruennichi TaxID=94029 RepID=UPI0024945DD0|nr:uncharacterized protein LOC129958179 [Argiope bruennichi]XP_055926419.1 uncharacterized protein LOC129958179 [Argiope bruennichi]